MILDDEAESLDCDTSAIFDDEAQSLDCDTSPILDDEAQSLDCDTSYAENLNRLNRPRLGAGWLRSTVTGGGFSCDL